MTIQFQTAVLFVQDIEASRNFYEKLLGQEVEMDFGPNVSFKGGFAIWQIEHAAQMIFERFGWQVFTEHRFQANGTTTYFDLFTENPPDKIACEIETTVRHAIDNARKAQAVGVPVWFVVPTQKVKRQIVRRLTTPGVMPGNKPIKVLLLGQLERELAHYMSRRKPAN